MKLAIQLLLFLGLISCWSNAEPQFSYPGQYFFRSGMPEPSYDFGQVEQRSKTKLAAPLAADPRFFFTTLTWTLSTSTSTSFITTTFTCTTSSAAIKPCVASGRRRRRGILMDDKHTSSVYYNEEDQDEFDSSIYIPIPLKVDETPVNEAKVDRPVRKTPDIPFVVEPGFKLPAEAGSGRFLLAVGTTTSTLTTTTTLTSSLVAICSSISTFQLCGSTGK